MFRKPELREFPHAAPSPPGSKALGMSSLAHIAGIQHLLDRWRSLGSRRSRFGVELIARVPDAEIELWMHAVFPGLKVGQVAKLERDLGRALPNRLRAFYRCCGGMRLFLGAFQVFGLRRAGYGIGALALQPEDLVALNHELDVLGWKPAEAVAFAVNSMDLSVHLAGMGRTPDEVVRCDRRTGAVLERHADVFACVDARLHKLDELMLH